MSQYVENIIQEKMDKINSKGNVYEVGRVIGVTDYIVEVSGLIQVSFNEKVVIAGHSIGYVSLIRRNSILRLLFVIFGLLILVDALLRIQMSVEAKKFGLEL